MPESIYLEIEDNENCGYMPLQVYEARADPVPVGRVRIHDPDRPAAIYEVTGWSSEDSGTPTPAMYIPVSDSGQALMHLVCGDDWGVRLRPADSDEDWDLGSPSQWGEPYLAFTDPEDVILDM